MAHSLLPSDSRLMRRRCNLGGEFFHCHITLNVLLRLSGNNIMHKKTSLDVNSCKKGLQRHCHFILQVSPYYPASRLGGVPD